VSKAIDLIGQRFGKLTVIERSENSCGGKTRWVCRCDCGKEKVILGDSLRKGRTSSCGCKYLESNKGRNTTHGQTSTRIYRIWLSVKQRCCYKNSSTYKIYGDRGITVCEEWKNDFQTFHEWAMSHGYTDELTIDRIDVNGNYEPSNCRWVDMKTQQNNRRNNRKIIYKGKKYTLAQLAEELNISSATLANRINSGWNENYLGIAPAFDNRIRRFL
jgi:hypothetical protein